MFVFYFGWKIFKKTKIVPLEEVPVAQFVSIADANPEPEPTQHKGAFAWFRRFWWD
jgi:amino acid transporter